MLKTGNSGSNSGDGKAIKSFKHRYWESTQKTLITMYGKRSLVDGDPYEDCDQVIDRVATAVAISELKYILKPEQIIKLSIEKALKMPIVCEWKEKFQDHIGNQVFWANTPANINSDPVVSLMVLQYEANGVLAGLPQDVIFLRSEELRRAVESGDTAHLNEYELEMGRLARDLNGLGCLAACGVAYVTDTLEGIQEAARIEAIATKASMGMGLNTSPIRPWASITKNGAAASGPDRFYEKTISKAVEAVAQGGRRGGALIELRNSDHPDILFFIDKKKLTPPPSFAAELKEVMKRRKALPGEDNTTYKKAVVALAEKQFGQKYHDYSNRQAYLKNTNITVIAMPGFMDAVQNERWYRLTFGGKKWDGKVFDPRKPVKDDKGKQVLNEFTKEPVFERFTVDKDQYPNATKNLVIDAGQTVYESSNGIGIDGYLYAPAVFDRIVENMAESGEPGIMFYELVNNANANDHAYDLDTCNPCGEQCLPAGRGKDGRLYMGNCNLSSLNAAHARFYDGEVYNHKALRDAVFVQQRFMDNVTDVSWYPIPEQNMTARMERRNGGGFAGIAEYVSKTGEEFGSDKANESVVVLFNTYCNASVAASQELAEERGVYPLWKGSKFERQGLRVRNSCMVNNAPTGTLAQMLQTSWGVDPHNGIVFSRQVRTNYVDFVAPGFREAMEAEGAWPVSEDDQKALMKRIRDNNKSCRGLREVPLKVQKAFPIRVEVSPEAYIRHLAACYEGCDQYPEAMNAISNTCSIPLGFNHQEIKESIVLAWKLGVKDLTFYPDGSRLSQPVEKIAKEGYEKDEDLLSLLGHIDVREVDTTCTKGDTLKVRVGSPDGVSTLHISLNHEEGREGELVEIYARMGKNGDAGPFEAIGRLCSAFLQFAAQFGEDARQRAEDTIVKQLIDIQSGYTAFNLFPGHKKQSTILSACDAIAKTIKWYRKRLQKTDALTIPVTDMSPKEIVQKLEKMCTNCGGVTTKIDGCTVCEDCGNSKCG